MLEERKNKKFLKKISLRAPAKINLFLKITGRRQDGYHNLETYIQKIALYDQLDLEVTAQSGIQLSCPGSTLPGDEKNIAFQAADLFFRRLGSKIDFSGISIRLYKQIPVAAGLGGGSSDAAGVLLGMNVLSGGHCTVEELAEMGLALGADVPLFVYEKYAAVWARGVGEIISEARPVSEFKVLLVNPGISVSTKWAYETFALTSCKKNFSLSNSKKEQKKCNRQFICSDGRFRPGRMLNDLEKVTEDKYRVITEIKQKMLDYQATGAMMSGSGPTVFGLFQKEHVPSARECLASFKSNFEQVYLVDTIG